MKYIVREINQPSESAVNAMEDYILEKIIYPSIDADRFDEEHIPTIGHKADIA
jgi:hypothetical protein